MAYRIRFGILPSSVFSGDVLVSNPQYGRKIGEFGSRPVKPPQDKIVRLNDENGFYRKLEESILREGFRNPIFCNAKYGETFCRYGTSRLWVAQKNNLEIPAIIADYEDRWTDLEELFTEDDIRNKYTDQPGLVEIQLDSMRIDSCPHSHLEE